MCSLLTAHGQDLRTGVPLSDGTILAAGECIAWLDAEGNVLRKRIPERPITALATDGEHVFALDSEGRELLELNADGEVVTRNKLPVQGRMRDLSLDGNTLWAITDAGEIVHGNPASEWTVLDFNDRYEGYYPRMDLQAVAAGGGSVMVAGMQSDGKPPPIHPPGERYGANGRWIMPKWAFNALLPPMWPACTMMPRKTASTSLAAVAHNWRFRAARTATA